VKPRPPETKVVASGVAGYLISLILQLLQSYVPHFHAPPAATIALLITTVTIIAGYLAPHTPRPGEPVPPVTAGPGYGPGN